MPPDGRMLWTYNSRSTTDLIQRWVQKHKFYATLPSRLDRAEEQWHDQQPKDPEQFKIIEHESDGSEAQELLGGPLQATYKFFDKDGKSI